jgi:hypothetical protein
MPPLLAHLLEYSVRDAVTSLAREVALAPPAQRPALIALLSYLAHDIARTKVSVPDHILVGDHVPYDKVRTLLVYEPRAHELTMGQLRQIGDSELHSRIPIMLAYKIARSERFALAREIDPG